MKKQIILTLIALSWGCLEAGARNTANDSEAGRPPAPSAQQNNATPAVLIADNLAALQAVAQDSQKAAGDAFAQVDKQQLDAQIAAAQEQIAAVQAETASQDALRTVNIYGEGRSRGRAVLVATSRTNAEALAGLDEDLRVMGHILDKTVSGTGSKEPTQMLGIFITAQTGGRGPQSLYLEGEGVVFIRDVKMALLPGLPKELAKTVAKKDSAWEEAKQEIDGPKRWNKVGPVTMADSKGATPYDAEKVEALKSNIIGSLKNAANIRGLADNETVTVVLQGAVEGRVLASMYDLSGGPRTVSVETSPRDGNGRAPTMIIRVKKADAEAALNGTIDTAELRKRATITVY